MGRDASQMKTATHTEDTGDRHCGPFRQLFIILWHLRSLWMTGARAGHPYTLRQTRQRCVTMSFASEASAPTSSHTSGPVPRFSPREGTRDQTVTPSAIWPPALGTAPRTPATGRLCPLPLWRLSLLAHAPCPPGLCPSAEKETGRSRPGTGSSSPSANTQLPLVGNLHGPKPARNRGASEHSEL